MDFKKLAAIVVLTFAGPAWSAEPPQKVLDERLYVQQIAEGGNQFASELYSHLSSDKSTNLFFSPYSISTALAMTSAGAKGQTEAEMASVLHFPRELHSQSPLANAELHPLIGRLRETLVSTQKTSPSPPAQFQLRIANRLWGQKGNHFLPEFLQITKTDYGAELGELDFKQPEVARKTINSWVDEQTDHKIQDLIAPGTFKESPRLVLTNAMYLKARWTSEFHKRSTSDAPFHTSDSAQVEVPTMHQTHRFRYVESEDLQVLELPYRGDRDLAMLILLPSQTNGVIDVEKRLTNENLEKWASELKLRDVSVSLPKFKMTSQFDMGRVLKTMGMPLAFSNKADFSGISTKEKLFISAVIHKAFVEVNEEGTEAAAATAIGISPTLALPQPKEPVEFRADHPFIFLIRDTQTKCVLFLGRMANPKG